MLKTVPLLKELNRSKFKEKKKSQKETLLDIINKREQRYRIPLKNLDGDNNDFDYFSIDSIINEPDYKIENFSLTGLNEVSLKRFFDEKQWILNKIEMRLKKLDCLKTKDTNNDNSCGKEIYKVLTIDMDSSNGLWNMVSTCLIGNSRLTPLLRLMTCYKLHQFKYEFYKLIELNYSQTISENVNRFYKVENDYVHLMFNSRHPKRSGDPLHFYAICTVLGKNIKIFSNYADTFENDDNKPVIYKQINHTEVTEKTLFSTFDKSENRYVSLIPFQK